MARQRLLGRGQIAVCMRSGIKCKASELVRDGRIPSLLVLPEWADAAHPQERPYVPHDDEGVAPNQPSPENPPVTEPVLLAAEVFGPSVSLSWSAAERVAGPRIEEYDIYRDSGTGFQLLDTVTLEYDVLGAILGPTLALEDDAVVVGETYLYKVVALTSNSRGLTSNTESVEITGHTSIDQPYLITHGNEPIVTDDGFVLIYHASL